MKKNNRSYIVLKKVIYDNQQLKPGEKVKRLNEWKKISEGEAIALFLTRTGKIPLFKDEVVKEC